MRRELLTYDEVRSLFDYQDGKLIRKLRTAKCVRVGQEPGWLGQDGYRRVEIYGRVYLAHRLIWMWHHGYFPENDLDHINQDKLDNRIENLREVSRSCNVYNSGNPKNNKSGVKGVHFYKTRNSWCVRINVKGERKTLGYPLDFDEAVLLRLSAEQCLERETCNSTSPAYQYAKRKGLIKF